MRYGHTLTSVFGLLGDDENDLTAALGFTLSRSPVFTRRLTRTLTGSYSAEASVQLEVVDAEGRTDLELQTANELIVVEAKRGWLLPTTRQLSAYATRIKALGGRGRLVTLSSASQEWAQPHLPSQVSGVAVQHLPWPEVVRHLRVARSAARGHERLWLNELDAYLRGVLRMRDPADSWTYCVAVAASRVVEGARLTSRQWVVEEGIYSHPFGKNWPRTPPNFLAFRWNNYVQQIRRVASAEVVPTLHEALSGIPRTEISDRPHIVYRLGPVLPGTPIPAGKNYQSRRLWVLLDQLLTAGTLTEAHETSLALVATAAATRQ